jgi:hypothetical protein
MSATFRNRKETRETEDFFSSKRNRTVSSRKNSERPGTREDESDCLSKFSSRCSSRPMTARNDIFSDASTVYEDALDDSTFEMSDGEQPETKEDAVVNSTEQQLNENRGDPSGLREHAMRMASRKAE